MTDRERAVLAAIEVAVRQSGRAPTGPDLAAAVGLGKTRVYTYLRRLEADGHLALESSGRGSPLKIRLTARGRAALGSTRALPRFGRIPAGPLTDVVAQADDFVSGLDDLIPGIREGDYLLEAEGESMIEAGIEPGMTLVMRPGVTPESGAICSVYVEGEGNTLKRVVPKGGRVILVPENASMRPQTYPADRVAVQGVLVAALGVKRF